MSVQIAVILALSALSWSAPPSCPSIDVFRARYGEFVGRQATMPSATVTLEAIETGYRATVLVDGALHARRVESPACPELVEAVALILSLSARNPESTPAARNPVAREPTSSTQLWLEFSGQLRAGLLRDASARARLAFSLEWSRLRLDLGIGTGTGQLLLGTPRSNSGISLMAPFSADVALGGVPLPGRLSVAGCGGLELGVLGASGVALRQTASGTAPWMTVLISGDLAFALSSSVSLFGRGFFGLNAVRPRVEVEALAQLFSVPLFAGGGAVGLKVRVW